MARVLVIDEEDMRRVVDVMLKNAGHNAVLAVDGNDALQKFEQQRFDLVICDLFMPNKDGIETLKELRRLDPAVPVIMMSGHAPSATLWEQSIWITSRWRRRWAPSHDR
jgi:CheY-like chemotaxis protein